VSRELTRRTGLQRPQNRQRPRAQAAAPPTAPAPSKGAAPAARGTAARQRSTQLGIGAKIGPKIDRLELGRPRSREREQPKVMYIGPWKRSGYRRSGGQAMNSLVDEIWHPSIGTCSNARSFNYHAVHQTTSQNGAPPKPGQQGEK